MKKNVIFKKQLYQAQDFVPKAFVIGRKYHCSWAKSRGMVWILKDYSIMYDRATLVTPRTMKVIHTQLSALRDINHFVMIRDTPQYNGTR